MADPTSLLPDPYVLEGVTQAPFIIFPDPIRLFQQRQQRLAFLAKSSELRSYLTFLADLCHVQIKVGFAAGSPAVIAPDQLKRARENHMPPLDRGAIASDPILDKTLSAFLDGADPIAKPKPAADALRAVQAATPSERALLLQNVLSDAIPIDKLAEHLYVAAAVQVYATGAAAGLKSASLSPVETGICPVCGGPPVASIVLGNMGAENVRYCSCAMCGTLWNEVRVKCMACGSTKGIGYRAVESGEEEPTVKAEVCDECRSWVKILYQNRNPSLEPLADDVASLGLDFLMRDTGYRRAGFNPFLLGY